MIYISSFIFNLGNVTIKLTIFLKYMIMWRIFHHTFHNVRCFLLSSGVWATLWLLHIAYAKSCPIIMKDYFVWLHILNLLYGAPLFFNWGLSATFGVSFILNRSWMKVIGMHEKMLCHRDYLSYCSNKNVFPKDVYLGNIFWNRTFE